jgi:hypothetical protein
VEIDVRLATACTFPAHSLLYLIVGGQEVVLESGEAIPARHIGETYVVAVMQQFGVVLHETLETGGGLELGLGGVSVFGVYELVDQSVGTFQYLYVGVDFDSETVGIAGQGAVSMAVDRLPATLFEQSFQLVVLHVYC